MTKSAKQLIKEAFVNLLVLKPFETVSVTEIVKEAKINRSTYYYYYYKTEEILEEIKAECITGLIESIKEAYDNMSVFEINQDVLPSSMNLFNHVYEKRKYYNSLLNSNLAYSFQNEFIDVITELFNFHFRSLSPEISETNQFSINFNAYGIFSMIKVWSEDGFKQSPTIMAEQLTNILFYRLEKVQANYYHSS